MPTLYVNASTGDDTRTYAEAQNSSTPWQTIGRAAWGSTSRSSPNSSQAAQAGDEVQVAAGTYTAPGTNDRWGVGFNPTNDGSSGSPITFRAMGVVNINQAAEQTGLTVSSATSGSVTVTGAGWTTDEFAGWWVEITSGAGSGQKRHIESNTSDTITLGSGGLATDFDTTPSGGDTFSLWSPGPVIGAAGASGASRKGYIQWLADENTDGAGWYIDEANVYPATDTGPVVTHFANNIDFERVFITGERLLLNDNHPGFRLEDGHTVTIKNCTIGGVWATGITSAHNGAGIMTYDMNTVTIEHNEIDDCGAGVFIKGEINATHYDIIVRFNEITNCREPIVLNESTGAGSNEVANNLIPSFDDDAGGGQGAIGLTTDAQNWNIHNNTIDAIENALNVTSNANQSGNTWQDNLCTNIAGTFNGDGVNAREVTALTGLTANYNGYDVESWGLNSNSYTTLSGWQTASSQEANSTTIATDPYTDRAGGDYTLSGGHAATTAASDGGPLGAYETGSEVIGNEAYAGGGGSAPTLTSPSLTVVSETQAKAHVTTGTGNGTLYFVVTESATAPSVAQVQAGEDENSEAQKVSGSQTVSQTGQQEVWLSGLQAGDDVYVHLQHRDDAAQDSTVVTTAAITLPYKSAAGAAVDLGAREGVVRGAY